MWLCLCSTAVSGLDFALCLTSLAFRTELHITTVLCTTDHYAVNINISLFSTTEFGHLCRSINRADRHYLCQSLTQNDQHLHFPHFTQLLLPNIGKTTKFQAPAAKKIRTVFFWVIQSLRWWELVIWFTVYYCYFVHETPPDTGGQPVSLFIKNCFTGFTYPWKRRRIIFIYFQ